MVRLRGAPTNGPRSSAWIVSSHRLRIHATTPTLSSSTSLPQNSGILPPLPNRSVAHAVRDPESLHGRHPRRGMAKTSRRAHVAAVRESPRPASHGESPTQCATQNRSTDVIRDGEWRKRAVGLTSLPSGNRLALRPMADHAVRGAESLHGRHPRRGEPALEESFNDRVRASSGLSGARLRRVRLRRARVTRPTSTSPPSRQTAGECR